MNTQIRGRALLRDPSLNKGVNFSAKERKALGLEGLLPFQSNTLDQQAARAYTQLCRYPESLDKAHQVEFSLQLIPEYHQS